MTTYTVINRSSGEPEGRNLSATDAADIILSHDGHEYELQPVGIGGWQLYVSRGSRNSFGGTRGMTECYVFGRQFARSYKPTKDEAWQEIAEMVCKGSGNWESVPEIMTDESYDAMLAEIAKDNS